MHQTISTRVVHAPAEVARELNILVAVVKAAVFPQIFKP